MDLRSMRFNRILAAGLGVALLAGCASPGGGGSGKKGKEASTLQLFLESNPDGGQRTATIQVIRSSPVLLTVDKSPFLDEGHIVDAAVIETVGGFAIMVKYDFHGSLALQSITGSSKGKRIAVYSLFTEGRWLAAPMVSTAIKDGMFTFTPDATREEAERIVRGLVNVAVALKNRAKS
jgi:hypothetical protein